MHVLNHSSPQLSLFHFFPFNTNLSTLPFSLQSHLNTPLLLSTLNLRFSSSFSFNYSLSSKNLNPDLKMSWQTYVDEHLMCDIEGTGNHLAAAAILGHDGTVWAQSSSFPQVRSIIPISSVLIENIITFDLIICWINVNVAYSPHVFEFSFIDRFVFNDPPRFHVFFYQCLPQALSVST